MKDPLDAEARRRIYGALKATPGAHFSELQRTLGFATGTLQYHLQHLQRAGLVDARSDGKYTRYFPTGAIDRRWKPALGLLRQPTPRAVVVQLLEHGPTQLSTLSERTAVPASTLSFHLKKLIDAGVVVKPDRGTYAVAEPDQMIALLAEFRAGFLDAAVDRIVGLLTGVRAGAAPPSPDRRVDDEGGAAADDADAARQSADAPARDRRGRVAGMDVAHRPWPHACATGLLHSLQRGFPWHSPLTSKRSISWSSPR